MDFNGQVGNEILNAKRMARFNTYNFESVYLDRWNGPGTSGSEPRVTNGGVNYEVSQRFLQSGDYFRLRNLTLGYTLPQNLLQKARLTNLRVYASATNLATWDSYTGYTPEVISGDVLASGIDRGVYPVPRTLNAGVQLGF